MMYIKILYLTLFHADDVHDAPDGTTVTEDRLEVLDGAQACVSSIPSGEAPNHVLVQSLMCLRCIRALLLMEPGDSPDARLLIRSIADEVDDQPAHELQPLLLALLARARMREYELTYRYTDYYGESFSVVLFSDAAGLPLRPDELATVAYKAVVAALLSRDVYNFGRLLTFQPFLTCLQATENFTWLLEWAHIFNRGDVETFERFVEAHQEDIANIPDLAAEVHTLLPRKVRLIALLHMVFYAPANARVFSFDAIAQRCQLAEVDDVEPLLMTALAQKILNGTVDGVDNTITITSVQPRVLQLAEVEELAQRVSQWRSNVQLLAEEAANK